MKKIVLAALAAVALLSSAFASDDEISFSNELTAFAFRNHKHKHDDRHTRFFGLTDRVIADYEGELLKVGVDATCYFEKDMFDDDAHYSADWDDPDWYVEFNPFDILGFGFSDELYTEGSYLPVWDNNVNAGNYSTSGFALLVRPIENLTIGAGIDFEAHMFGRESTHGDDSYKGAVGVNFDIEKFAIGGSIHNIGTEDALNLGGYASLKMIENFVLNVGMTHAEDGDVGMDNVTYFGPGTNLVEAYDDTIPDDYRNRHGKYYTANWLGIRGENVLSAGLTLDLERFKLAADLAFNIDPDYEYGTYDFYTAGELTLGLTEAIALDVQSFMLADFGDDYEEKMTFGIKPKVAFTLDKHELSAGMYFQTKLGDRGYKSLGIPLSWKYTY